MKNKRNELVSGDRENNKGKGVRKRERERK